MDRFVSELDRLTTSIMTGLRSKKIVDDQAMSDLKHLLDSHRDQIRLDGHIDVDVAGKVWWLFPAMLAEADHAKDPEPILDAAWGYQESVRQIFGPHFG